jgi:N-acetylneuraminate synthase|tara:strand:+ start:836 stop:1669 length:834 start_codon:yes stop_codon:yes gene_type:complete
MVFIVAEIGINHNGDMNIAKKLIDIASDAGCDAVKFQKRNVEKVYSSDVLDFSRESPWGKTTRDQKLGLEFSIKQFSVIDKYCKKKGIPWYVSCWDVESQIEMRKFKTKYNKIASAMLIHTKLLETVAKEKKYTFISTGMSTLKNISDAVKIFRKHKCPFELMHSHGTYPMRDDEANLRLIPVLAKKYKCNVGYSGHEIGSYNICIPAIILGATSIERHITLGRTMYGSDQAASLEASGLQRLVRDIRLIDKILGDGKKRVWPSELPVQKKLRQKLA